MSLGAAAEHSDADNSASAAAVCAMRGSIQAVWTSHAANSIGREPRSLVYALKTKISTPWESAVRLIALFMVLAGVPVTYAQTAAPGAEPIQHEFVIKNFKTESGVVLPEARIVYGTYGKLNAEGDNAILLPSHYMAEMHGYELADRPGQGARSASNCSSSPASCSAMAAHPLPATRRNHFTVRDFR